MLAETGRGSVRRQPAAVTWASISAVGGSIAMVKGTPAAFGTSSMRRKFTCFDHTYCSPSNSMFLPLFSQVAMVVKASGAPGAAGQRLVTTGGRVGCQGTPHSGTIQPGP